METSVFLYNGVNALYLQMEAFVSVQPGVWDPSDGSDDLHDSDGQSTQGAWWIHACGPEHPTWSIHHQLGLLPALHTCSGTSTADYGSILGLIF